MKDVAAVIKSEKDMWFLLRMFAAVILLETG